MRFTPQQIRVMSRSMLGVQIRSVGQSPRHKHMRFLSLLRIASGLFSYMTEDARNFALSSVSQFDRFLDLCRTREFDRNEKLGIHGLRYLLYLKVCPSRLFGRDGLLSMQTFPRTRRVR